WLGRSLHAGGQGQDPDRPAAKKKAGRDDDRDNRAADRAAIRKATQSFIKAFESGDARAVAAHWTPQGEYISDEGVTYRGGAALEKAYREFFADTKGRQVEVEVESLRFLSRDTAVEEGYMKVRRGKNGERTASRYSVLHVREDGKWRMAVVREWPGEG